jgi:large subunit ribosomal protein L21
MNKEPLGEIQMTVIFEDRGRQYTASENDVLYIDKIDKNENDKIEFDKILFFKNNDDVRIGTPYIDAVSINATVVKNLRDDKIIVFKFKRKKNYKRTRGHKQPYTMIKIDNIKV